MIRRTNPQQRSTFLLLFFSVIISSYETYGEVFDVTTVFLIRDVSPPDNSSVVLGTVTVVAQGIASGLPITTRENERFFYPGTPCCDSWTHDGWSALTKEQLRIVQPPLQYQKEVTTGGYHIRKRVETVYPFAVWALKDPSDQSLSSNWISLNANLPIICLSVVARIPAFAKFVIRAQEQLRGQRSHSVHNNILIDEIQGPTNGSAPEWVFKKYVKRIAPYGFNARYRIDVKATLPRNYSKDIIDGNTLLVQWISDCAAEEIGTEYRYHRDEVTSLHDINNNMFSFDVPTVQSSGKIGRNLVKSEACYNGGMFDTVAKGCRCKPGFGGTNCERGCGGTRFGAECSSSCANRTSCHGQHLCPAALPCTCMTGLRGSLCDTECAPHTFGASCTESCGECKNNTSCNPFTGVCEDGCAPEKEPPFCKSMCGRRMADEAMSSQDGEVSPLSYPWNAAVYFVARNGSKIHICSGSLVRPSVVVTAAECAYSNKRGAAVEPEKLLVAFGKLNRVWDSDTPGVQKREVNGVYIPSEYRGAENGYFSNIAVLHLSTPVIVNVLVSPICFDWTGQRAQRTDNSEVAYIAGWGANADDRTAVPTLRQTIIRRVASEMCPEEIFGTLSETTSTFCGWSSADGTSMSPVTSDVGAGLAQNVSGTWYLEGVAVSSPRPRSYTGFTSTSFFRNWLYGARRQTELGEASELA